MAVIDISLTRKSASVSFNSLFQVLNQKRNLYRQECCRRMIRASLVTAVLALAILSSSCTSWIGGRDSSIPRLLTPLAEAKFDDLVSSLKPFTDIKSLRTSQVYLQFIDAMESYRYPEAYATMILQRPDKIRLLIQSPGIRSKISDMVSESNHFRVAVFYGDYKRFLLGTNDADYSQWREKLGERSKSALVSARPFHFTEVLLIRPLTLEDPRFTYGIEEALIEEPDARRGAKKSARVLRSYYVVSEIELSASNSGSAGPARTRRRFWFDRINGVTFSRQQIYDNSGQLTTDIHYSEYKKLNDENRTWPSLIMVSRPHDSYAARITFNDERFEIDPDLPENIFVLENTEGLPETDLDKPITP
jgi:hypothetical protein